MASLPEATVTVDSEAGAQGGGTDLVAIFAAVAQNADVRPRMFSSSKALLTKHLYSPGASYVAHHIEETKKPVLFVPLPIVTAGTVGSKDASGNTGTSVVSVAAASGGILEETSGSVKVVKGGVAGTDQIVLGVSLDAGRNYKNARIGTALSYTLPYVGLVLSLKAGTLIEDDIVLTWETTAPRWDQAGLQAGRLAMAAQKQLVRTFLVVGDCINSGDATDILTEVNAYESSNNRFVEARAQVPDRKRAAKMSRVKAVMTGTPSLTFAEVGATGDTITRDVGSWITDGFAVGDVITVTLSASNNVTGPIASLSATVITLGTTDLVAEVTAAAKVVASNGITFAEVGATADTITRTAGSWIADGFKAGDEINVTGTALNNVAAATLVTVTATVLTLGTTDLAAEVIGSHSISITTDEQSKTDAVSDNDAAFAAVDAQKRIDLGHGRGFKKCLITGYLYRRPFQWAASLREYQHDVHIPTYRKEDKPCVGWSLEDAEQITVEHDERQDGGALAARFSCFTTFSNGPSGPFVALSLTREVEDSVLSRTHNMAVANVACSVIQSYTENAIGKVLQVNKDGTGTAASLKALEEGANTQLQMTLLQPGKEGPRASGAEWTASRTDVLKPNGILHGTLILDVNGTLERIETSVLVK